MLKLAGIGVLGYALYAAATGEVHSRSGVRMRTVCRSESPVHFWAVTAIYAGLGIAMLFYF
ncbi:MAG TPA: hypothetical protein VFL54_01505 [Gammaproteobacteria bacterium]|jgi:hypothetical protein|nr:hypothetical protein [Gammaproteobacteria bacterium]